MSYEEDAEKLYELLESVPEETFAKVLDRRDREKMINDYQNKMIQHAEDIIAKSFHGIPKQEPEDEKDHQRLRNFGEDIRFLEEEFGFSIDAAIDITIAWWDWRKLCG